VGIYALLIGANLVAWTWALMCFHGHPVLLGTALLAYSFGLRHAVDADHIAAIASLNDHFGVLGFVIIGVFVVSWTVSILIYRRNRYDEIEASAEPPLESFP